MSNTNNYNIPYLEPNQTQKEDVYNDGMNIIDEELKNLDDRTTALEQGGGSGGSGYDDTELRGRIEQNESDIEALQNADIQITEDLNEIDSSLTQSLEDISELKTFRISITNRVYDTEQKNINQDNELSSLDSRVASLEQGGGSGYDDSELRDLISDNSDKLYDLELLTNSHTSSINNINSVNSNQNNTLSDHEDRILTLEEGFEPVDLTPLLNRLDDVESDVSTLYENIGNLNTSFDNLQDNVNTFDSRIINNEQDVSSLDSRVTTLEESGSGTEYDDTELRGRIETNESDIDVLQLNDAEQDSDISSLDSRVTTLEESGSGTEYDDTELRGRIETNESDIDVLQLNYAEQDSDIDALEITTQDHETRITTLEQGGGTGGGDMPQTGEIRKFSRAHIPSNWYEINDVRDKTLDPDFYLGNVSAENVTSSLIIQANTINYSRIKHTKYNDYYLLNGVLSEINKNGVFELNSNLENSNLDTSIFQNNSNELKLLTFDYSNTRFILQEYNLTNNTYTTDFIPYDDLGENWGQNRRFTLINKDHTVSYRFYPRTTSEFYIIRVDLVNKTSISVQYSVNTSNLSLIYFNDSGDICLSQIGGNGHIVNKDTLSIETIDNNSLISSNDNIFGYSSGNYVDIVWVGDNQLMYVLGNNSRFIMIENYQNLLVEDVLNIDINAIKQFGGDPFFIYTDSQSDIFYFNGSGNSYSSFVSKNKIDGAEIFETHKVVDCIYNIPQ